MVQINIYNHAAQWNEAMTNITVMIGKLSLHTGMLLSFLALELLVNAKVF